MSVSERPHCPQGYLLVLWLEFKSRPLRWWWWWWWWWWWGVAVSWDELRDTLGETWPPALGLFLLLLTTIPPPLLVLCGEERWLRRNPGLLPLINPFPIELLGLLLLPLLRWASLEFSSSSSSSSKMISSSSSSRVPSSESLKLSPVYNWKLSI